MLLKVVLFAYSQGIVSSRGIERACQEHVTFLALCGDHAPHFTTIARFVSTLGDDIAKVFAGVLAVCDAEGPIGREMFAMSGVKLPSNASKQRSGTRADFERQASKLETTARTMVQRHRATDTAPTEPLPSTKARQRVERLERDAQHLRAWLANNPDDRRSAKARNATACRARYARYARNVCARRRPRQYAMSRLLRDSYGSRMTLIPPVCAHIRWNCVCNTSNKACANTL